MIEPLGLPTGLSVRPATIDDVAAITALIEACESADNGMVEIDATDVVNSLDSAPREPVGAIVVAAGDRSAAWGSVHGQRADVDVHPDWRGRGIGAAMLGWAEATIRATGEPLARQTVTDSDRAAALLFEAAGYHVSHVSWILEITLGDRPPDVAPPAGLVIREFRRGDERAVYRLIEDAFSEWPGREPLTFDAWAEHVLVHPAFSGPLSRLAFDDEALVGAALAMDYPSADEGWVQQLATRASHRNRGVARAVLASVFGAVHARGRRMVGLSTDSRTGALSLYERLGMRIRRSYTGWLKDL